jgi:predicted RNA methylase
MTGDTPCSLSFYQHRLENTTALDVGANVGYMSFVMAGAGSRVLAVEALPSNAALLTLSKVRLL